MFFDWNMLDNFDSETKIENRLRHEFQKERLITSRMLFVKVELVNMFEMLLLSSITVKIMDFLG